MSKYKVEKYLYWFAHREPFVPYETMIKMMVRSTSRSSNEHGVIEDNNNLYRNIVMDAMRMNQSYASKYSTVAEEPNIDATRFFDLLKDYDEPLWDERTNHSKLLVVPHVLTI